MSDNSNGFNNSWTILTPEETDVETVGPGHDGNESLADTPSLPGEVTGSATVPERGDGEALSEKALTEEGEQETDVENVGPEDQGSESVADTPSHVEEVTDTVTDRGQEELQTEESEAPTELVLSEEGLQVCQETAPEITQSPASPSPTLLSPSPSSHIPLTSEPDTSPYHDSHATVSPSESSSDSWTHITPAPESPAPESPVSDTYTDASPSVESHAPVSPPSDIYTHVSPSTESPTLESPTPDIDTDVSPSPDIPTPVSPYPDSTASIPSPTSQEEEDVSEPAKTDPLGDSVLGEGEGLRRRHVLPPTTPEHPGRAADEEEEDEDEEEFRLVERREDGGGISLNKCIVGALILLSLGSIIFSGIFVDLEDEDDSEVTQSRDPEQRGNQEWLNQDATPPTPQEVTELLGKLAEENQQMTLLQAQIQSQKEELNLVLKRAEDMGKEPPAGQTENQSSPVQEGAGTGKEKYGEGGGILHEGEKEIVSTQESRTRGRDAQTGRETERRMEGVERRGGRKKHWEGEEREGRRDGFQGKDWRKGREDGKEWKQRADRKDWKGEDDWKHGKHGGKDKDKEWIEKKERKQVWEKEREWSKDGERKREGMWKDKTEKKDHREERWRVEKKEKDWKTHRDGWRTEKDGNVKKREERGMGREKSKKERHGQGTVEKTHRHHEQADYWKHQREKLQNKRPPADCRGIAECARKEGLAPAKLDEFQQLLEGYLSKLGGAAGHSKEPISRLVRDFFVDGIFAHHKIPFREFVEDVADMLEDVVEGDHAKEEEMEEFEKEALKRFSLPGGGEREGRKRGKDGRVWG